MRKAKIVGKNGERKKKKPWKKGVGRRRRLSRNEKERSGQKNSEEVEENTTFKLIHRANNASIFESGSE